MRRPGPGDLRLDLVAPVTQAGFGPLQVDLFRQWTGQSLAELVDPLLLEPPTRGTSPEGVAQDVYPLAWPDGRGLFLNLGALGEIALQNDGGLLVVAVPRLAVGYLLPRIRHLLETGPLETTSSDGVALSACWLRLQPGTSFGLPLGLLGELSLRAP